MKNSGTRHVLAMSVISMMLCMAVLIGMTFAWFTDVASTNVSKIQAGNLDISLEIWDVAANENQGGWVSAEGNTIGFIRAEGTDDGNILWEPGCTYKLNTVKIKNDGELALKYKVLFFGVSAEGANLAEVIDVYMRTQRIGTLQEIFTSNNPDGVAHGKLEAGADVLVDGISLHMHENAGNQYKGMSIDEIAVTVMAVQDTVEYDSNGSQYDKDALYKDM